MTQKEIIIEFYQAFQQLDSEKMTTLYHDEIIFEDPAFGILNGDDAKNMWRMLCENAIDLKITYSNITETSAHWEANYIFSKTGKRVHNIIEATFEFKDGKISKHTDVFNLHQWAKQGMGFKGFLLGGTSFFKKKLKQQTQQLLKKFTAKNKA